MRIFGRLVVVPLGLALAVSTAAAALLLAALFDPVIWDFAGRVLWTGFWWLWTRVVEAGGDDFDLSDMATLYGAAAAFLVAPSVVIGLIGEVLGWRSLAWYAGGTGLISAAMPWLLRQAERSGTGPEGHLTLMLLVAGASAGLVYWMVAGWSAGRGPALRQELPSWQDSRPR